jgi:hypothetical protein
MISGQLIDLKKKGNCRLKVNMILKIMRKYKLIDLQQSYKDFFPSK